MDKIDCDIVELLRLDGRLSYRELGERIHLSANAVAERVRRLQAKGTLTGFYADVNLADLGLPLEALIEVKMRAETSAEHFEAVIQTIPGIVDATLLTGSFDYLLRVACADQQDLVRLIEALRERAGVQETYSRMVLRQLPMKGRLGVRVGR
ncbi:Lrp/AsnC family transcriptional regulator [Chitinimonas arctica]|uniref:Lrp/AsnC family transcriptional regulator n=1 Tax=Chitinimonas arctica TaxID=2594795 RepID=A0A516SDD9_9NEIS|nr:Lrp/AsnC family transcriptional regulator [Chitinimonas arctica]QDQ26166.1 Lrp/AsnC family transcriptional regulator [Chitinimonas arctica]